MADSLFDPIAQAREAGAAVIEEPIINRPFEEPQCHWRIVTDWEHFPTKKSIKGHLISCTVY